jgi:putative ABC transport system permease protein
MLYFPLLPDLGRDTTVKLRVPFSPGMPSFIVRSDALPTSLVPEFRRVVHDADSQLAVTRIRTLAEIVDAASARARLLATLLSLAAGAAVVLGIVGVYGVASYAADQRRREIGLRVALGATPSNVSVMLLRQGIVAPLAGIGAGLAGAVLLGRVLRGFLYEISPSDPLALCGTAAILLVVGLTGSWLPARRAARADPMRALRSD